MSGVKNGKNIFYCFFFFVFLIFNQAQKSSKQNQENWFTVLLCLIENQENEDKNQSKIFGFLSTKLLSNHCVYHRFSFSNLVTSSEKFCRCNVVPHFYPHCLINHSSCCEPEKKMCKTICNNTTLFVRYTGTRKHLTQM